MPGLRLRLGSSINHVATRSALLCQKFMQPNAKFISIHYAYIIVLSFIAFGVLTLTGTGEMSAIDTFLLAVSCTTSSGLNPVDIKDLTLGQQMTTVFFTIVSNNVLISIVIAYLRRRALGKLLEKRGALGRRVYTGLDVGSRPQSDVELRSRSRGKTARLSQPGSPTGEPLSTIAEVVDDDLHVTWKNDVGPESVPHVHWSPQREQGTAPAINDVRSDKVEASGDEIQVDRAPQDAARQLQRTSSTVRDRSLSRGRTMAIGQRRSASRDRTEDAKSLGSLHRVRRSLSTSAVEPEMDMLTRLSSQVTVGRNSNFRGLTAILDCEEVLRQEYHGLGLLLKVQVIFYMMQQISGIVGLLAWILSPSTVIYRHYLDSQGQSPVWWAIYSSQTMVNNLGLTLTPDSMLSFRDAAWPVLLMTWLALIGNTCYSIALRGIIWVVHRFAPHDSPRREASRFLLQYPRRCSMLLMPCKTTIMLLGLILGLNIVDVLFIILCDLDTPEVASLLAGPRILAAIFQAASTRSTGTSAFNLAKVDPIVQFFLWGMMYAAMFPVTMAVRSTNAYEEKALGKNAFYNRNKVTRLFDRYLLQHVRSQISADLWFVFLGTLWLLISEQKSLEDPYNTALEIFSIIFECMSAYANVGLSLGTTSTSTSLCGDFSIAGKVAIIMLMWRGRRRGLPHPLDLAVKISREDFFDDEDSDSVPTEESGPVENA